MSRYADILIPLTIDGITLLTYAIDDAMEVEAGDSVSVPMGHRGVRFYTGIVWRIHDTAPAGVKVVRTISKRLYGYNLLPAKYRKFWEWVADYYLSSLAEVMVAALPSLAKPVGTDEEAFAMAEYKAATERYITLAEGVDLDAIPARSHKLRSALEEIMSYRGSHFTSDGAIPRRLLTSKSDAIKKLEAKGFVTIEERERSIEARGKVEFILPKLTPHQDKALSDIENGFESKNCALLQGVTGSGKTEVYIHLIAKMLREGRDVLLLVPEIALTTQLIERMERIFGSRVTPYHSKLTARRRTEIFLNLARGGEQGNFIVGVRSSIFLPLNNLGLIIVDEEHDSSYKQSDPAPRYNARDAAHIIAALYGAKVLLGSATPSLESWMNGYSGKFARAFLTERYSNASLPTITVSDSMRAGRRHERRGHFNKLLIDGLEERLAKGEQSMLFQNRRGFAPYVECGECGWVARCPNCNVSLTMHKAGHRLLCHYCDFVMQIPKFCPSCSVGEVLPVGFGTEKIEEQVNELIPAARTLRLDRDTATSPTAFERIIGSFGRGESDILIGTQMIAKGFDFSRVTLVGVLSADNMLNQPDFRAEERAFAMLMQVAGRAGRREGAEGEVIIQSTQPEHRILRFVEQGDFEGMARTLLREREAFFYPPYSRITAITLKHTSLNELQRGANMLSVMLRERFSPSRVRGPVTPPVDMIRGEWIVSFLLKIESGASTQRARTLLREVTVAWRKAEGNKNIKLIFNVDPL